MAGNTTATNLREIPLGKAILLSIVTLSIYYWIQVWRNSQDIQAARTDGFGWWKLMFVLGFFTGGLGFVVLYVLNFIQVGKMRADAGGDNMLGIVALVLTIVTAFIGSIVWNIHWNQTVALVEGRAAPKAPPITATA